MDTFETLCMPPALSDVVATIRSHNIFFGSSRRHIRYSAKSVPVLARLVTKEVRLLTQDQPKRKMITQLLTMRGYLISRLVCDNARSF